MTTTTKTQKTLAVAALALAAVGAYWHFSPYLAMRAMQTAAEANDAIAFNEKVDYPKLRESLKEQMATMLVDRIGAAKPSADSLEAAGAALALAFVNPLIDALVRPELGPVNTFSVHLRQARS